jgi:hypothetical protein
MRRPVLTAALALLTTGGLMALSAPSALADSSAGEIQQTVNVLGNGSSVQLDHSTIQSGSIRFRVSSSNPSGNGSQITMFQPKGGATVSRVLHDFQDEFSQYPAMAADGTRELTADARFLGLADPAQGQTETITEFLSPGTYYLLDAGNPPQGAPTLTTLTVRRAAANIEQDSDLASQITVQATSADRFVTSRDWPHQGTYTFKNVSDTLHFMELQRVKNGTTDAQVQSYFDSGSQNPPSFALPGPSAGNDVVSPGGSLQLTYNLPAGTYVLLCFVADDVTGMPHALMGMHKVVVLH